MRLLLDENLSESIATRIRVAFPDVEHVRRARGTGISDAAVWALAKSEERTLVTLDADFQILSLTLGAPPKVIWLDAHNASTADIARVLVERRASIQDFIENSESTMLVLSVPLLR
jgi:predicted nuclease of predicted toxin-antitoxin system